MHRNIGHEEVCAVADTQLGVFPALHSASRVGVVAVHVQRVLVRVATLAFLRSDHSRPRVVLDLTDCDVAAGLIKLIHLRFLSDLQVVLERYTSMWCGSTFQDLSSNDMNK